MKPRLLDLFCCAGGCSMGYHRAGFEVVGVDNRPQPRYPFEFHQADALEFCREHGREFEVIHASPPCQKYTLMNRGLLQSQGRSKEYPDLIAPTRQLLIETVRPFVIENVVGAPLNHPFMLCGSSFGLLVQRHRIFESNIYMMSPQCFHTIYVNDKPPLHQLNKNKRSRVVGCYGNGRGKGDDLALWSKAMGITWMTRKELAQAIPPAYTEFIGRQLMQYLRRKQAP